MISCLCRLADRRGISSPCITNAHAHRNSAAMPRGKRRAPAANDDENGRQSKRQRSSHTRYFDSVRFPVFRARGGGAQMAKTRLCACVVCVWSGPIGARVPFDFTNMCSVIRARCVQGHIVQGCVFVRCDLLELAEQAGR